MTGIEYSAMKNNHKKLFDEYYNYVYTVVYGRIGGSVSREDVEECVSDIFAEFFFTLDQNNKYDGELKGFISTVAKRRAIDRYRIVSPHIKRLMPLDDDIDRPDPDGSIELEAENNEKQRIILEKIEALGEPDASIIVQKYYFNKNSREIAESLSMKTSAVRMRCSRALKKLKVALIESGISL